MQDEYGGVFLGSAPGNGREGTRREGRGAGGLALAAPGRGCDLV